jgi:hypothetical protein
MHLGGEFDHGTDDEHRGGSGPGSQEPTGADRAGDPDQDADLEPDGNTPGRSGDRNQDVDSTVDADAAGVEIPIGVPMTAEQFRAAKLAAERPDPPGQR